MSEFESSRLDDVSSRPSVGVRGSAGALLKAAREAQGLHIAALAVALKVPVKKLEALEADQFDLLPDIVFVRALAASVCRTLKIDPVPVLDNLPTSSTELFNSKLPVMSVPFKAPQDRLGASLREQFSKPLIFVVLSLLMGGLVLMFVPLPDTTDTDDSAPPSTALESPPVVLPAESRPTVLVESSSLAAATLPAEASPPQEKGRTLDAGAALAQAQAPSMTTPPPGFVPGAATGLVVFTARGASWVEVIDATASVKLRKNLAPGEVVNVSGIAPLSVVVGRADVVDVQLRGKPFDLIPIARENVARFEVK